MIRQLASSVPTIPWLTTINSRIRAHLMLNLLRLRAAVPSEWMQAVTEVVDVAPTLDAFWKVAWATLGWRLEGKEIRLEKLTVRIGTALQLHAKMQSRRARQLVFQQSALSSVAAH